MVVVKGMEKPNRCGHCRFCHRDSSYYDIEKGWFCYAMFPAKGMPLKDVQEPKPQEWCPLQEVKNEQ